jgi:hypothetical protein
MNARIRQGVGGILLVIALALILVEALAVRRNRPTSPRRTSW